MADQISDAVLDTLLTQDPMSRVACETLISTGLVTVAGEVTTKGYVDIPSVVRGAIHAELPLQLLGVCFRCYELEPQLVVHAPPQIAMERRVPVVTCP
jgi:hypothetical protein